MAALIENYVKTPQKFI